MEQPQLDFLVMTIGFSVGMSIFVFRRLLSARLPLRPASDKAVAAKSEAKDAKGAGLEPDMNGGTAVLPTLSSSSCEPDFEPLPASERVAATLVRPKLGSRIPRVPRAKVAKQTVPAPAKPVAHQRQEPKLLASSAGPFVGALVLMAVSVLSGYWLGRADMRSAAEPKVATATAAGRAAELSAVDGRQEGALQQALAPAPAPALEAAKEAAKKAAALEAVAVAEAPAAAAPPVAALAASELAASAVAVGMPLPAAARNSGVVTMVLQRLEMPLQKIGRVIYARSAYWGTLSVGSPGKPFKVVLDTGSGHLILPSTYCHSPTCRAHQRYRRSGSLTARDINYDGETVEVGSPRDQITVSFGTGEVSGIFIEDSVCLDRSPSLPPGDGKEQLSEGQEAADRCVSLRMIAATEMSEDPFMSVGFDGVMGLGLPGLSQAPEFNFLHVMAGNVRAAGGRRPNTFAVFLAASEDEESKVTFGGYDEEHLQGEIAWNPVFQPELGHWMVEIKRMRIDDHVLDFCREGCRAVMDTGTSLFATPGAIFAEVYSLLRHEATAPSYDCRGAGPKLHIELETFTITLEPKDYARLESQLPTDSSAAGEDEQQLAEHSPITQGARTKGDEAGTEEEELEVEMCKPMLMSMDQAAPLGPKLFIMGEPVLQKYYTVYDSEVPQIGFARATHAGH
eukprot:CAMPEP_0168400324 /NCGR_PEP_ID=MMETSP0228-20121227/22541_1 /TAXON_ID=133427 /ORGANISM="Protoceratium reticulatum, Strain CCCM 535 (=CCMP 1889)" /LENGTH=678 /DNA_ID=CAMNT_0008413865 /DNA_START=130 /DNA_END=2166 /DNA_ORIENTATION=+